MEWPANTLQVTAVSRTANALVWSQMRIEGDISANSDLVADTSIASLVKRELASALYKVIGSKRGVRRTFQFAESQEDKITL